MDGKDLRSLTDKETLAVAKVFVPRPEVPRVEASETPPAEDAWHGQDVPPPLENFPEQDFLNCYKTSIWKSKRRPFSKIGGFVNRPTRSATAFARSGPSLVLGSGSVGFSSSVVVLSVVPYRTVSWSGFCLLACLLACRLVCLLACLLACRLDSQIDR